MLTKNIRKYICLMIGALFLLVAGIALTLTTNASAEPTVYIQNNWIQNEKNN